MSKPNVTKSKDQTCLYCKQPLPVGSLGYNFQHQGQVGRVHPECRETFFALLQAKRGKKS